jgi:hypothetical protein
MTHFIRQQYLDIDLKGSESEGFALQNRLSGLYYDQMLPSIEKALDSLSVPESLMVIDRLDIDAGTIRLDRLDLDLTESVVKLLTQCIEKEVAGNLSKGTEGPVYPDKDAGGIHKNFYAQTTDDKIWEVFIYFLEKGHLPWSYRLQTGKSLEEVLTELLLPEGKHGGSRIPVERILEMLKSPGPAKRRELQFSENFNRILYQTIFADIPESLTVNPLQTGKGNEWEAFVHFLLSGNLPASFRLPAGKSLEGVLTEFLKNDESLMGDILPVKKIVEAFKSASAANRMVSQFSEDFTILILRHIFPDVQRETEILFKILETSVLKPEEAGFVRKLVLEKILHQSSSGLMFSKLETANQVLAGLKHDKALIAGVAGVFSRTWPEIELSGKEVQWHFKDKSKTDLFQSESNVLERNLTGEIPVTEGKIPYEISEGIFIDNAGLVLLHPFLPGFFDALGISMEDEIVQPERALSLLHYLTTGQSKIPEYELVLPKILCDLPLSMPVPADYPIAENEIAEVSAMLEAVIKHWEALRDTSPDGLRGTFLLRPGKLSRKADGDWLLQVETRTFDILLDYLPWGISMIRLPWMKKILSVEWKF